MAKSERYPIPTLFHAKPSGYTRASGLEHLVARTIETEASNQKETTWLDPRSPDSGIRASETTERGFCH